MGAIWKSQHRTLTAILVAQTEYCTERTLKEKGGKEMRWMKRGMKCRLMGCGGERFVEKEIKGKQDIK